MDIVRGIVDRTRALGSLAPLQLFDLIQQLVGSIHLLAAKFEAEHAAEDYAYCDAAEEAYHLRLLKFSASEDIPDYYSYPEDYGR